MPEDIEDIVQQISFENKEEFRTLLYKCIHVSKDSSNLDELENPNIIFKIDTFFKGFPLFINAYGKDKKYLSGVEALMTILTTLGVEVEKEDCFLFFHLRDLGKFRMREEKLYKELLALWPYYKEFKLEPIEFSRSIKDLMRTKLIGYRRGNLTLNQSVLIRYRRSR